MKLLDVKECSELLHLAPKTIYKYICCRRIPYIKIGSAVRFDEQALKEWIDKQRVDPLREVAK